MSSPLSFATLPDLIKDCVLDYVDNNSFHALFLTSSSWRDACCRRRLPLPRVRLLVEGDHLVVALDGHYAVGPRTTHFSIGAYNETLISHKCAKEGKHNNVTYFETPIQACAAYFLYVVNTYRITEIEIEGSMNPYISEMMPFLRLNKKKINCSAFAIRRATSNEIAELVSMIRAKDYSLGRNREDTETRSPQLPLVNNLLRARGNIITCGFSISAKAATRLRCAGLVIVADSDVSLGQLEQWGIDWKEGNARMTAFYFDYVPLTDKDIKAMMDRHSRCYKSYETKECGKSTYQLGFRSPLGDVAIMMFSSHSLKADTFSVRFGYSPVHSEQGHYSC